MLCPVGLEKRYGISSKIAAELFLVKKRLAHAICSAVSVELNKPAAVENHTRAGTDSG